MLMVSARNTTSLLGVAAVSVVTLLLLISAGQVPLAARPPVDSAVLTSVDAAQPATQYKYEALYEFCDSSGCPDIPNGDLIFDAAGNLYGTTFEGGDAACGLGCGTVFQLSPKADGTWKLTTIFKFDGRDGAYPAAGLVMDVAGNLYGTTSGDTGLGDGTVFELSPRKDGAWKFTTLVKFTGKNGSDPEARLILGPAGKLYGTTSAGGDSACDGSGCGTVFQLAPAANGKWKLTTLFKFNNTEGANPYAALIFDAAGNLYGTASGGGKFGEGTVFKLSPAKGSAWTLTTLFNFNGADGAGPGEVWSLMLTAICMERRSAAVDVALVRSLSSLQRTMEAGGTRPLLPSTSPTEASQQQASFSTGTGTSTGMPKTAASE